ncbi:hypothetical protein QBC43DRAFT_351279, partial [Cladorrhinum sp. PSN259]
MASPQPSSSSLPASRPLAPAPDAPSKADGLDPRYVELAALKRKHEGEKREHLERYEAKRREVEDEFQKEALKYTMLDGAPELHEQLKKLLRENFSNKMRDLEVDYEKEKTVIKKCHDAAELKMWESILNLDTTAKPTRLSQPPTNGDRLVSQNTPPPSSYYPHLAAPRPPPLHSDYARHTPPPQIPQTYARQYPPAQQFPTLMSQAPPSSTGDRDLRVPSSMAWPHPPASHHTASHPGHAHPLAPPTLPPMMLSRTPPQPQAPPHPQYQQSQALHQQQPLQPQPAPQQRHPLPGLEQRRELPPILAAPSGTMPIQLDERNQAKRKAESLAVSSEAAAKRSKQSHNVGSSEGNVQQPARTVTFDEIYADGNAEHQHMIIQFPEGGPFYILRCDEHGVHFGEHPLRGAAKHLASAQHGKMSKEHSKAVETLGHRVLGCTTELMEKNNAKVMKSFTNGYKPFNANQLSKTKRALKGYPNLDKPATPAASPSGTPVRQRKPPANIIWNPTIPGLYVGFSTVDQKHYPVIMLPWNEPTLESAGIGATMADVGLLSQPEKLPKCYVYSYEGDQVTGVSGWAEGYEDAGPLSKRREFAALYVDGAEPNRWQIGWIQAKNLLPFELERPQPEDLPFFTEAREYYARSIRNFDSYEALRREMFSQKQTTILQQAAASSATTPNGSRPAESTPRHPLPSHPRYEDLEMVDAGASEAESDRASTTKSSPHSDEDVEMTNTDSRRTSVSNRDETKETSTTPGPLAQAIAAQALSLQAPARSSGFTAINSRSTASSVEPASRQGSVERKRVEKIYASSRRREQGPLAASVTPIIAPKPTSSISVTTGLGISNALRVERAESAPAQPNTASAEEQEQPRRTSLTPASASTPSTPALGVNGLGLRPLPSVQPLPSQYPTPLPSATESTQSRTPLPPMSFSRPAEMTPAASPLDTPTASALNSRSNSPAIGSFVSTKSESTPLSNSQTPVPGSAEQEVFEIGLLRVGENEVYNAASTGGAAFRLTEDSKTGVFKVAEGSPEAVASLEIDPQKVKMAIRVPGTSGVSCLVKVVFVKTSEDDGEEGKKMELVFETMTASKRGPTTGKVLAARFCRRLKAWNKDVECP